MLFSMWEYLFTQFGFCPNRYRSLAKFVWKKTSTKTKLRKKLSEQGSFLTCCSLFSHQKHHLYPCFGVRFIQLFLVFSFCCDCSCFYAIHLKVGCLNSRDKLRNQIWIKFNEIFFFRIRRKHIETMNKRAEQKMENHIE